MVKIEDLLAALQEAVNMEPEWRVMYEVEIKELAAAAIKTIEEMTAALEFYADPGTYHACGFFFDRPTGGFDEDFSEDHGDPFYDRPMPGKLARQVLASYYDTPADE